MAAITGISFLAVLLALFCCTCYSVVFWANKLTMMMMRVLFLMWWCSHVDCQTPTPTVARWSAWCQLWVYPMTWVSSWSRVRLVWSTTHKDLESPVTWLQMDVLELISTLDSNWMESNSVITSAQSIPESRCSLQSSLSYCARLTCSRLTPTMKVSFTYR